MTDNGFHTLTNNIASMETTQKTLLHDPPPPYSKPNTFWTLCNFCRTQFEYLSTYRNTNLVCQNCRKTFHAVEMPSPPINGIYSSTSKTSATQRKSHGTGKKTASLTNKGPAAHSDMLVKRSIVLAVTSSTPKPAAVGESLHQKIPVLGDAGTRLDVGSSDTGSTSPKLITLKKKRRLEGNRLTTTNQIGTKVGVNFETRSKVSEAQVRDLSQRELRNMLMEKAKKHICMHLSGFRTPCSISNASNKETEKLNGKEESNLNGMEADANKCLTDTKVRSHKESFHANSNDDAVTKDAANLRSMAVTDPDFHDFDKDRTEKSFADSQVWAAYDDDDGMPRYYALIHNVVSRKQLTMRLSWLNSKNNRELSPMNWIGSGFTKTSGDFWIGKHKINKSLNSFSHKVRKWEKGTRGTVRIYPSKGEVWALYRNWSSDWSERTPAEVIHKYDMVEVLEDFIEERGVIVAPLIKVAGFKTVFRRHPDCSKIKTISREELFRLSHQVPSYFLTGQEGGNAPKDCWELDPASLPMELLQVLSEVQVQEMAENAEKAMDSVREMVNSKHVQLVENGEKAKPTGAVDLPAEQSVSEVMKDEGKEPTEVKVKVYTRKRHRT